MSSLVLALLTLVQQPSLPLVYERPAVAATSWTPVKFLSPVAGRVAADGQPVPTQVEPHGNNFLVISNAPPGAKSLAFEPGGTPPPASLALTPGVNWALLYAPKEWSFEVDGVAGGSYRFVPRRFEILRPGPVEVVFRASGPVLPSKPEKDSASQLPHLGVATLDVRAWSRVDALDVRLMWEGGVVDEPLAFALFNRVRISLPGEVHSLNPAPESFAASGVLPHHAKVWSFAAVKPGRWSAMEDLARGHGWARPPLPLRTALGLDLSRPSFISAKDVEQYAIASRAAFFVSQGSRPASFRHPIGVDYGGPTGGDGIGVWRFYLDALVRPDVALDHAWADLAARTDRTRTSLVSADGRTYRPGLPDLVSGKGVVYVISPEPLYGNAWNNSWPSDYGDPFGFRSAQPEYREAYADLLAPVLGSDKAYGSNDPQHYPLASSSLWPLVELFAEPMAELIAERRSAALRTYYGRYLVEIPRDGSGSDLGREFAWLGWHESLCREYLDDYTGEAFLQEWADAFVEALGSNGTFNRFSESWNKEKQFTNESAAANTGAPSFRPAQTYQRVFLSIAARQVAEVLGREDLLDACRQHGESTIALGWGEGNALPDYVYAVQLDSGKWLKDREEVEAHYVSSKHPHPTLGFQNRWQSFHVPMLFASLGLPGAWELPSTSEMIADQANWLPLLVLE